MYYCFKQGGGNCKNPCAIVSWNEKFQDYVDCKTRRHECERDDDFFFMPKPVSSTTKIVTIKEQTNYHVLSVEDVDEYPEYQ